MAVTFPDDLPEVVVYLLSYTRGQDPQPIEKGTLPRNPVVSVGSSGVTNAAIVQPRIPYGAQGWRLLTDPPGKYRAIKDIPAAWLPFLDRPYNSEMYPFSDPVKEAEKKEEQKKKQAAARRKGGL